MNAPDDDSEFERRAKALFDRSVTELDAPTRTKLAQARATALNEVASPATHRRWRVWAPITGLAAAAVAAVAVLIETKTQQPQDSSSLEDLDLLAQEDLDMIQDVEFYAWLDEQA
ncbi:MAG: hypothetical protein ABW034_05385, partial [Steroidobacteraceae bacterium]